MEKDARSKNSKTTVPVASNEVRLSPKQCVVAGMIVVGLLRFLPVMWESVEQFEPGPDYRIPYSLSHDYWIYQRHSRRAVSRKKTLLIGDSVVWGHYVSNDETLSHGLNRLAGDGRFANLGVDGIHPAALAGLVQCYGGDISDRDVILHCNLLWMSSKRHDLQSPKEFSFNHPELVPQFFPRIPCYRESLSGRLGIVVGRNVPLFAWTGHLRAAYFDDAALPVWTTKHPYANPAAAVTFRLPSPAELPSPKPIALPWTEKRMARFNPPWVELETSFQWSCFRRIVENLRQKGNRVFVLVGPLNEHMLTDESLHRYKTMQSEVAAWLQEQEIAHCVPDALPSVCYADASHPLADGYARLAEELFHSESFRRFDSARK